MSINKKNHGMAAPKRDWRKLLYQSWIVKNVPFFLFLSVLTIVYIANGHYADKAKRKISLTSKRIKELEFEYKTLKREVIFRSKESELVKSVEPLGLKELLVPPMIIGDS
ncbi:MAG: FtsL-like putative cell division protein, partial [Ginsengibacter sp.]